MTNDMHDNFKSALIYIKEKFGTEAFKNSDRILAIFSDIAPNLKSERSMLSHLAKIGTLKEFASSDGKTTAEKKQIISIALNRLIDEEFIQPEIAEKYLIDLIDVFKWNLEPINSYGKKQDSKKAVSASQYASYMSADSSVLDSPINRTDLPIAQSNTDHSGKRQGIFIAAILFLFGVVTVSVIHLINKPVYPTPSNEPESVPAVSADDNADDQSDTSASEITMNIHGADDKNRIVIEASNSRIDPLDYVSVDKGLIVKSDPAYVSANTPGTASVIYTVSSNSEKYGNESKDFEYTFVIEDTKAPIINLSQQTITVSKGKSYDPYSNVVSIMDEVDSAFTYVSSADSASGAFYTISNNLNTKVPGAYTVSVYAEDSSGNSSESSFTVKVQEQERFVAIPSGCTSKRTDYDTLYRELDQYGKEYTSPSYATKDEMRVALREFEREKYPDIPCQVYPGLHIYDGEEDEWIFYDYNPWDD